MSTEALRNREEYEDIMQRYRRGELSKKQAKLELEPILKRINERGAEIAKKYGRKYYPIKLDPSLT